MTTYIDVADLYVQPVVDSNERLFVDLNVVYAQPIVDANERLFLDRGLYVRPIVRNPPYDEDVPPVADTESKVYVLWQQHPQTRLNSAYRQADIKKRNRMFKQQNQTRLPFQRTHTYYL